MYPKQVIVVRTDLRNTQGHKVRTGKLIAQAAHASMGALLSLKIPTNDPCKLVLDISDDAVYEWLDGSFTKIALAANNEATLHELYANALAAGIPSVLITDNGQTEFGGVKVVTALAIGPAWADRIDEITTGLSLL